MRLRPLGTTGLQISALGLGTWAAGGENWSVSLGPQDDEDSRQTLRQGLEAGINWIDTAPVYGLGHAERLVGTLLSQVEQRPLLMTKCGFRWTTEGEPISDLTADSIRREIEGSIERLGTAIDVYFVHWPLPDEQIEEAWTTLAELKSLGFVRYLGASNFSASQLERVSGIAPVDAIQARYSLLDRHIEREVLHWCRDHGTGVLVFSPLALGLLGGTMTPARVRSLPPSDWRRRHPEFELERLRSTLAVVDRLGLIARAHGCAVADVAVAWTLTNPDVAGVVLGPRRPAQLVGVLDAPDVSLTEDECAELDVLTRGRRWVGD
jgi:aryl-alcohol dehydrogenase-like predicted oxidoreductase